MIRLEPLAVVCRIDTIRPHPNADRLDVIRVYNPLPPDPRWPAYAAEDRELVTGKHYRAGDLGVWLKPGAWIPGWLAYQLWMVGKKRAEEPFEVREIEIRGVASPGLWVGSWYRNDSSKESALRADDLRRGGGTEVNGWISWGRWDPLWEFGQAVDSQLGVTSCPPSSVAEQLVANQQVAARQSALGAIPAAGSNLHRDPGDEG